MSHSSIKGGHLTTAEAAALLDVSVATLKRWAQSGLLPSERTEGGHRRFRLEDVKALTAPPVQEDAPAHRGADLVIHASDALALQAWLLQARRELGSWWSVAQPLRSVVAELYRRRSSGHLGAVALETGIERLRAALHRCTEAAHAPPGAPRLLVGAIPGDHLLAAPALLQLAAIEAGWQAEWAGHPDARALGEALRERPARAVICCGSRGAPLEAVRRHAQELEVLAEELGVPLAFLGMADWPEARGRFARLDAVTEAQGWLEAVAAGRPFQPGRQPAPAQAEAVRSGGDADLALPDAELRWDPTLALGHAVIDAQHETLFTHVRGLLTSVRRGEVTSDLPELLAFITDYAQIHFRYEEELMRGIGYPGLDDHRQEHQRLAGRLAQLVNGLGERPTLAALEGLAAFMIGWLRGHVGGTDQGIAAHLRQARRPG